jgi:hypothetical protein
VKLNRVEHPGVRTTAVRNGQIRYRLRVMEIMWTGELCHNMFILQLILYADHAFKTRGKHTCRTHASCIVNSLLIHPYRMTHELFKVARLLISYIYTVQHVDWKSSNTIATSCVLYGSGVESQWAARSYAPVLGLI